MRRTTRVFLPIVSVLAVVMIAPIVLSYHFPVFQDFLVAYWSLVATVVLVGLTAWYAIATSETLAEARKDRRRPIVKHVVDVVLEGLVGSLDSELQHIERREYDYHKAGHYRFFNPFPVKLETDSRCENETERYILKTLLEENPRISALETQLSQEHNELVSKLRGSYEEISKALKQTTELVASFQTVTGVNLAGDGTWYPPFQYQPDLLAAVLIDYPDPAKTNPNLAEFLVYEANADAVKRALARPEVQERMSSRDQIASRLEDVIKRLRGELAGLQQKLFNEYLS